MMGFAAGEVSDDVSTESADRMATPTHTAGAAPPSSALQSATELAATDKSVTFDELGGKSV